MINMHVESRCLKQKEKYHIICCFDLIEQRHKAKIIVPNTYLLTNKKYAHFVLIVFNEISRGQFDLNILKSSRLCPCFDLHLDM